MASKKLLTVIAALTLGFTTQAFAEEQNQTTAKSNEGQTSIKAEEAKKGTSVTGKEDIDNEITNKKMRAELGSKSKVSMSMDWVYSGGPIAKPLGKDRPNITGDVVAAPVSLSGNINGRYRIDTRSSLAGGIGLNVVQPFHAAQKDQGDKTYLDKAEINDPSASYSYATKLAGGLQLVNSASVGVFTNDRDTAKDTQRVYMVSTDATLLMPVGEKGDLQLGLVGVIGGSHFKSKYSDSSSTQQSIANGQDDYLVQFYPFIEYVINDTYNLRTVFRQTSFYHLRSEPIHDLVRNPGSQSIGLGISVTRDIFLYPNFQFSTENLSTKWFNKRFAKESTVGLTATINVF